MEIWEDLVSINSADDAEFVALPAVSEFLAQDNSGVQLSPTVDVLEAIGRDSAALPLTEDREGYYGDNHYNYWASGLRDMLYVRDRCGAEGASFDSVFDLGCASGRVLRHMHFQNPGTQTLGADINRRHVLWIAKHLPVEIRVFQSLSVPSLPLEDNSVSCLTAFSVLTHIEAFDTAWLMEARRVVRPGGLVIATVHTDHTLGNMTPTWPIHANVVAHPDFREEMLNGRLDRDRLIFRWHGDRSYSSNVFYRTDYLQQVWGRIMTVVDIDRQFDDRQDAVVMRVD